MKAIVLGSTGLVGGYLTRLLTAEETIKEIILLNRRKSGFKHPKIKESIVDFNNVTSFEEKIEADYLFCCLGTTIKKAGSKEAFRKVDYDLPLEFAGIFASKNHLGLAVITALGSNSRSPIFYNQVKGELEDALKQLPLNRLVIVRPSLLLGKRDERRFAEEIGQKLMPLINPLLPGKYKAVEAKEVAETMLKVLLGRKKTGAIDVEVRP